MICGLFVLMLRCWWFCFAVVLCCFAGFAGLGVGWYVLCGVAGFGFVVGFRVWCFGILWLGCFFALT